MVDSEEEAFEEKKVDKKGAKPKPTKKRNKDGTAKAPPAGGMGGGAHAVAKVEKVMMTATESHKAISEYMERQNRPYSLQNVMDNLHGRITRKNAGDALEDLT